MGRGYQFHGKKQHRQIWSSIPKRGTEFYTLLGNEWHPGLYCVEIRLCNPCNTISLVEDSENVLGIKIGHSAHIILKRYIPLES